MWGDGGVYGTWANYLERWEKDPTVHAEAMPRLQPNDFTVDTWTRLMDRLFHAIGGRLSMWSDAFSASMARADSEFSVGTAMTQARTGLLAVLALVDDTALPEDLRGNLRGVVEQQVRSAQQQLEQQLDRMERSGTPRNRVDARRRTIHDNPLDAVLSPNWAASHPTPAASSPDWSYDPAKRPRRTFAID